MPSLEDKLRVRRAALVKLQGQLGGKESQKRRLEDKLTFTGRRRTPEQEESLAKYNKLRDEIALLEERICTVKKEIRSLEGELGR